jgi:MFS family permease
MPLNQLPLLQDRRWQMTLVFMVTLFVAFLDRINITFALPLMAQEYGWTDAELQRYGSLLMGFFYGAYGLSNIFLTPFANRIGTRRSLFLIIVLWSIFTALGAVVSQFMMLLLATRVLLGLSEGVHVPMMATAVKAWFPLNERSRANSIVVAGIFLAILLSPMMLVPIMAEYGWRAGFHLLAGAGLVISMPLVYLLVHDTPQKHPSLPQPEREYIASGHAEEEGHSAQISWRDIWSMPSYLLFILIGVGNNLVGLGLTTWIPSYYTNRRGIPFEDITWLVAGPYAFSLLGLITWATLGDRLNMRAALTGGCAILAGGIFFFALDAPSITAVIVLFSIGVFLLSSFQASEFALLQRVIPQEKFAAAAGTYNGLSAFIGGGLGPLIMSPMIGDGSGTWMISLVVVTNGLLLLWFYRMVRY